jgi:hypothetical protein
VTTDTAGRFRFEENASHMLRLQAIGADGARGEPTVVRLWFRAQNVELAEPLRLRPRTP